MEPPPIEGAAPFIWGEPARDQTPRFTFCVFDLFAIS
jgi:hypothetical protein